MPRKHNPNLPRGYRHSQSYNLPSTQPIYAGSSDRIDSRPLSQRILAWIPKLVLAGVVLLAFSLYPESRLETSRDFGEVWGIQKHHLSDSISEEIFANEFPSIVTINSNQSNFDAIVHYNIKPDLNSFIDDTIARYGPDYAAVVVLQPHTGRILAMSSFVKDNSLNHNLAVHSGFPAASLFKIVTAAAAIDTGVARPGSIYQYNGKNSSLYKSNVLRHKTNKWTRNTSLSKAFALSINTVFGRIGVYDVGAETLKTYADVFGFNRPVPVDFSIESSKTGFHSGDEWSIAEAASGYTLDTTISPVHAAMLASVIANDGVLVEPSLIDFAVDTSGPLLYKSEPDSARVFDKKTSDELRVLMRATVKKGSAKKHFRTFFKGPYVNLDVGGKTGSLTGHNPKGKTEWFVGYGDSGKDKVAIAAVVVNKEKWYIKPARLARFVLEEYFKHEATQG